MVQAFFIGNNVFAEAKVFTQKQKEQFYSRNIAGIQIGCQGIVKFDTFTKNQFKTIVFSGGF